MAYFESEMINSGRKAGVVETAWMIAAISPAWLDCWEPGSLVAALCGSSGANHIPLPHLAFSLPLLKQAPSVYTVIVW